MDNNIFSTVINMTLIEFSDLPETFLDAEIPDGSIHWIVTSIQVRRPLPKLLALRYDSGKPRLHFRIV